MSPSVATWTVVAQKPGRPPRENRRVSELSRFSELAAAPEPALDAIALALAAEFRDVDASGAFATLDALGAELLHAAARTGAAVRLAVACGRVLGDAYGFAGDRQRYEDPRNSMLDIVLSRRRGLPILLSVVYIEVARRAQISLTGVGLPGHFVVAHFGADPPVLLDPFAGGRILAVEIDPKLVRPWRTHEIAMRILNNLLASYQRRGNLTNSIRAAKMRLMLPASEAQRKTLAAELRGLLAQLN